MQVDTPGRRAPAVLLTGYDAFGRIQAVKPYQLMAIDVVALTIILAEHVAGVNNITIHATTSRGLSLASWSGSW